MAIVLNLENTLCVVLVPSQAECVQPLGSTLFLHEQEFDLAPGCFIAHGLLARMQPTKMGQDLAENTHLKRKEYMIEIFID